MGCVTRTRTCGVCELHLGILLYIVYNIDFPTYVELPSVCGGISRDVTSVCEHICAVRVCAMQACLMPCASACVNGEGDSDWRLAICLGICFFIASLYLRRTTAGADSIDSVSRLDRVNDATESEKNNRIHQIASNSFVTHDRDQIGGQVQSIMLVCIELRCNGK